MRRHLETTSHRLSPHASGSPNFQIQNSCLPGATRRWSLSDLMLVILQRTEPWEFGVGGDRGRENESQRQTNLSVSTQIESRRDMKDDWESYQEIELHLGNWLTRLLWLMCSRAVCRLEAWSSRVESIDDAVQPQSYLGPESSLPSQRSVFVLRPSDAWRSMAISLIKDM